MPRSLKLYHLIGSANSAKVRIALAYKKIPHEKIPVDPANRRPVIEASGQPLTPVLLHGDTVVFDSYAILRYLDGNFRDTPRLYSEDRDTIKKIETWEMFARTDPYPAVSLMFVQMRAGSVDPDAVRRANGILNRAASHVEEALGGRDWLLGAAPTAADFTVAPVLRYGAVPETAPDAVSTFFRKHLRLESGPGLRAWVDRVMAFDR